MTLNGVNSILWVQHQLNQNNQHIVTLESKNGLPIAFKGFFVQARAVKSNGTSNPMGSWDVSGANGLAKVTLNLIRARKVPTNVLIVQSGFQWDQLHFVGSAPIESNRSSVLSKALQGCYRSSNLGSATQTQIQSLGSSTHAKCLYYRKKVSLLWKIPNNCVSDTDTEP